MEKPHIQRPAPPPRSQGAECCTDSPSDSACRNNYFDGKRLTTDSFRIEQRYFLERRYLLNRALYGWGVVYGFGVAMRGDRLSITSGVALDKCGREVLQVGTASLTIRDLILLDPRGARATLDELYSEAEGSRGRLCWLLSVHYAEQSTGSVKVDDSCHCQREEWERTCETVRYSLRLVPRDECCREDECELTCDCSTEPCCQGRDEPEPPRPPKPGAAKPAGASGSSVEREHDIERKDIERKDIEYGERTDREPTRDSDAERELPTHRRGGCRCLCDHLTKFQPPATECSLCEIDDPCGAVRVDLRNGVALACLKIGRDERDCPGIEASIEACGPRRLVKRNDLLFDLIRGCDLTRISRIGWEEWHRRQQPVPFEDFSAAFGPEGDHQHEYVTRRFWVEFSRPVRRKTLQPDCFVMRVMSGEREGGWWMPLRVPILRVETDGREPDLTTRAAIVVDGAWLEDGVRGRRSLFLGGESWVEIEVRGDLITDCIGQQVDANARGLSRGPTGNGSPGSTFISTFRVAAARPYETSDRKGAAS